MFFALECSCRKFKVSSGYFDDCLRILTHTHSRNGGESPPISKKRSTCAMVHSTPCCTCVYSAQSLPVNAQYVHAQTPQHMCLQCTVHAQTPLHLCLQCTDPTRIPQSSCTNSAALVFTVHRPSPCSHNTHAQPPPPPPCTCVYSARTFPVYAQ